MERVGKMWDNLRKGCRTLFHPEGGDGADVLHVQGPQRGHHCVSSEPQGPEKGVQADGWPEAVDPLLSRRDSYSRHTPWGGRKRLSSAQTPSSPETDRRSGGTGRSRWQRARPGPDAGSLRCRLRNTVVLCLPLPQRHPCSPRPSPKVRLAELTMEECPFRPGSDLARKWHEIKRQQQQQQLPSSAPGPAPARPSPEDEEECLRERRRLSIEAGVDAPPHAQIHTVEGPVPVATLYRLGPKLAPGGGEGPGEAESDPEDDATPLCLQARRPRQRHSSGGHAQIDFIHCLVPDLHQIAGLPCYWGPMDRYQAEALLEGKPEGTFLLRDSAQEDYLFSVSFRRYGRSLHARVEQWNHNFSFDAHDPCVFHAPTVSGLLEHYRDPGACMFFEPLLTAPLHRTFPFSLQHLARAAFCRRATYDGIAALPLPPALRHFLQEYHYKQRVRSRLGEWQPPRPK